MNKATQTALIADKLAAEQARKQRAYERAMAAREPKGDNSDDVVYHTDPNYLER